MVPLINPQYLDANVVAQIARAYKANNPPSVQLGAFLQNAVYETLTEVLDSVPTKQAVIADRYSRNEGKLPANIARLFTSKEFCSFIKRITGKDPGTRVRLELYGHRDFTLRQDDEKPPGLLVYFDMTDEWLAGTGGETIVTDEHGELVRVAPAGNTLVLIDCARAYPFVRYINHKAGERIIARLTWY